MFSRGFKSGDWPLQNIDFVFREPVLCWFLIMFGVIVLLEGSPMAKSQLPGRGNQVFGKNVLVPGGIYYAIDLNKSSWTTGSKTARKHQWSTTIFDSRYEVLFLVCIPCLTANMPMVYMAKKLTFWSHLTIAPCSSHNSNDVWQIPDTFICWLLSVRAFFVQPFQRACWYGGGVLWLILRLCDPKMQLKSAVLELCSWGSSLPPSPSSSLCVGTTFTCVLFLASL